MGLKDASMRSPSFRASRSAPGFASLYDYLRSPGDLRIPESALQVTLYVATKADLTRLVEWIAIGQERPERVR
jgi:hypothetical protein